MFYNLSAGLKRAIQFSKLNVIFFLYLFFKILEILKTLLVKERKYSHNSAEISMISQIFS